MGTDESRNSRSGQRQKSKRAQLVNLICETDYRHRSHETLRWMLDAFLYNLFAVNQCGPTTVLDLPPDNARDKVSRALDLYLASVREEEPFEDILGDIYMEVASRGAAKWLAQYFSPMGAASMMAQITIGNEVAPRADGTLWTACDPACGSGVMMLAAARQVLSRGQPEWLRHWSFCGCDLDPICARMMAVQFIANVTSHRLPIGELLVIQGNSLTLQDLRTVLHVTHAPQAPTDVSSSGFQSALQLAAQSILPAEVG